MATVIAVLKLLPTIIAMVQKAIALGEWAELEYRVNKHASDIDKAFAANKEAATDVEAAAAAEALNEVFKK